MFEKKGQGLPLNTIIIAIIVIVVLVVIILIFVNQASEQQDAYQCSARGGDCKSACTGSEVPLPGTNCDADPGSTEVCCVDYGITT